MIRLDQRQHCDDAELALLARLDAGGAKGAASSGAAPHSMFGAF